MKKNPFRKVSKPKKAKPKLNIPDKETVDKLAEDFKRKIVYIWGNFSFNVCFSSENHCVFVI